MASLAGALRRGRRLLGLPPVSPIILMYHRVAEPVVDPWDLAVSPAWFERQMAELRRYRTPMPIDELVRRLRLGTAPRNAVAVTFDDGYVDNLVNAKPMLMKYQIPATLFVLTGSIGQGQEFWWDELAKLTLGWAETAAGCVRIAGEDIGWSFPPPEDPSAGAARLEAHQRLWAALRAASPPEVREAMAWLRALIGQPPGRALDRAMTEAELAAWLDGGLTQIAPHTVSHRPVTALSADELEAEITGSVARCAEIAGRSPSGFAYPYGDRSGPAASAIQALGVEWACSTRAAAVTTWSLDYFDLPRLQVRNGGLRSQFRTA